ncbi:MAG: response regulator [Myxococcota bacterium]
MRAAEGARRTPIIALTAATTVEDRRRCLDAGMDDHIAKPITRDALAEMLDRWFPVAKVQNLR